MVRCATPVEVAQGISAASVVPASLAGAARLPDDEESARPARNKEELEGISLIDRSID